MQRVLLAGVEEGIEAGFSETRWVYCEVIAQAPFEASVAGQTAESVVIEREVCIGAAEAEVHDARKVDLAE